MARSAPRHFGAGSVRLADVMRPREVVAAPAVRLAVDLIDPSDRNPRRRVEVDELAASIRTYGLLQPVVVRRTAARYTLVAGHRRLQAVKQLAIAEPDSARWREIEAVLRDTDEDGAYLLTLTENLQREDLSPRDEATALEQLVRQQGWSVRRVAEAIHRAPAYVSKRLRVFDDVALAGPVLANQLAVSTAEELLRIPPEERLAFARRAIAEGWSPGDARRAVGQCFESKHPADGLVADLRAARRSLDRWARSALPAEAVDEARSLLERLAALV